MSDIDAEVIYVQGMSNPTKIGQYPATKATIALVLGILGFSGFSCCTAIPGLLLANSAAEIANQYPGHPDIGMAKAAKMVNWTIIGISIFVLIIYVVVFVILGGILWANSSA
jgi:hypothetical protein